MACGADVADDQARPKKALELESGIQRAAWFKPTKSTCLYQTEEALYLQWHFVQFAWHLVRRVR